MSYLPASLISVKKNGIKLGAATECSVSVQSDLTEVAGATQGTAAEYVSGKLSWSVSANQLLPSGNTATDHYGSLQRGDLIEVAVLVGGMTLTGNGYVTSVKTTHDVKNAASVSIKVSGSGPLVPSGKTGLFYDAPVVTATVTAPTIPAAGGTGNINVQITGCTQHWAKWLYGSIIEQGDIINDGKDARFMCTLGTHDTGVSLSGTAISAPGLGDTPQATHVCAVVSYRFYVNGMVSDPESLNVYQLANDGSVVYHPAELLDVPSGELPSVACNGTITLRNGYTTSKLASGDTLITEDIPWTASSNSSWLTISYSATVPAASAAGNVSIINYAYTAAAQPASATAARSALLTFSRGTNSTSCSVTQSAYNLMLPIRFYVDPSLYAQGQTVKATVCYTEAAVTKTHILSSRITVTDSQLTFPVAGRDLKDITISLNWIKVESSADALGDVSLEVNGISEDYEPKGAMTTMLYPKSQQFSASLFLADKVHVRVGAGVANYRAPYIDETTGNWFVWDPVQGKFVDTGQSSKGDNGYSPQVGENGNWWEWDPEQGKFVDTGKKAQGENGKDAHSPYVGSNGNWYLWNDTTQQYEDSGRTSRGDDGNAPYIGSDGYWYEYNASTKQYEKTDVKAQGIDAPRQIYKASPNRPSTPSGMNPSGWLTTPPVIDSSSTLRVTVLTRAYNGAYAWNRFEDGYYISCDELPHNGISVMQFGITCTKAETLSFDYVIGSESNYDFGYIGEIDNTNIDSLWNSSHKYSGSSSGTYSVTVSAGSHTILVGYKKDGSQSVSPDCFKIRVSDNSNNLIWVCTEVLSNGEFDHWSAPTQFSGKDGKDGEPGAPGADGKTPYLADVASSVPHYVYTSESNYDNPSSYYKVVGFYAISGANIRVKVKNLYSEEITLPCDFYTMNSSGQYGPHLGFTLTIPAGTESYYTTTTDSGYFPHILNLLSKILVWRTK